MNYTKNFRFDFLGALKCLFDCDDRLRNELAKFLEVKVCTVQASNNVQLFGVKLSLYFVYGERFIMLWDICATLMLPFIMNLICFFSVF